MLKYLYKKCKKMKISGKYIVVYFIILMVFLGGMIIGRTTSPATQPLPTITQIQQELVRRGHDIKADGRLGPATQKAWDAESLKGIIYKNFDSVIEADRKARGL